MQKKIIALAVAALASTAAFAQTNVTVYGIADGSFDLVNIDNGSAGSKNTSINRVSANSSYIGFKGVEDLGNGLKAVFQFETAVSFDNGAGFGGSRDSYVGLSSGFGTVVMGNLTGPTRALGAGVDINAGATGIGANSGIIGKMGGNRVLSGVNGVAPTILPGSCGASTTCASVFDTRWANAIAYISPTFAGFSAVAAFVPGENKTNNGADGVGPTLLTTGYDVGVNWAGAGFKAGVAYNWAQIGNIQQTKTDNVRIAGGYAGTWGRVNALWEQTMVDSSGITNKQQKWGLGAGVNLGKGEIIAQYYEALNSDNNNFTGKANGAKDGAFLAEVGYVYNLSKRTSVKAIYAYLDNNSAANFDFGVNASGAAGTGTTIQGMQVGLRHSF